MTPLADGRMQHSSRAGERRALVMNAWTIAAGLLVMVAIGGCACDRRDGVVEIRFWAMGREGEVVRELLPAFESEHPGIRVRLQQMPWIAAHEKLLTAFAGDATPDLCQLGNTWVPEFAALGALEDLGPWSERSEIVHEQDFFAGVWATNVIDERVFGVPWYVDTRLLFYRTDILRQAGVEAPPATWREWEEAMRRIKSEVGPGKFAILLPTNEFDMPVVLALQQPSDMLRDGGTRGDFESPDFRRAFTFYVDMFRQGWAPAVSNTQISNVWQEFADGYFSFYMTGPWNIGEFRRRLPDDRQGVWMTTPMPGPDEVTPGVSMAGGSSLVMFRTSQHKPEAWALVEYLSRPEVQVRFHELTGNLPANENAWNHEVFRTNPYARAFRRQLEHVRPSPKVPEWERIAVQIRLHAERVINGRTTIDEALHSLNRVADELLEKRRWMLARDKERRLAAP